MLVTSRPDAHSHTISLPLYTSNIKWLFWSHLNFIVWHTHCACFIAATSLIESHNRIFTWQPSNAPTRSKATKHSTQNEMKQIFISTQSITPATANSLWGYFVHIFHTICYLFWFWFWCVCVVSFCIRNICFLVFLNFFRCCCCFCFCLYVYSFWKRYTTKVFCSLIICIRNNTSKYFIDGVCMFINRLVSLKLDFDLIACACYFYSIGFFLSTENS